MLESEPPATERATSNCCLAGSELGDRLSVGAWADAKALAVHLVLFFIRPRSVVPDRLQKHLAATALPLLFCHLLGVHPQILDATGPGPAD